MVLPEESSDESTYNEVDATSICECETQLENVSALLGFPVGKSAVEVYRDRWGDVACLEDRNRCGVEVLVIRAEIERGLSTAKLARRSEQVPEYVTVSLAYCL